MNLTRIEFDNRYIRALPADKNRDNYRRQVNHAAFSFVNPTHVINPSLVAVSPNVAEMVGFTEADCRSHDFVQLFSGNQLLDGMEPYALCYGGHQFGNWAGQLGDGRAINLGEAITPNSGHQILQLKGAGSTPYSRQADGLAVLRSSVREFLCSEAMYHLGIPTTRALSLCLSGEEVIRDMFYDGNRKPEPGAIVCRVSSSFTRFGSFQLPTSRGDKGLMKAMVEHCIRADFPILLSDDEKASKNLSEDVYLRWYQEVCDRTSVMVMHWMRVGFVHGVMNTDNMSIIGETIDYGPYGWIDNYDPDWTPNTTDAQGKRYRFETQPDIAMWNLFQLAKAIMPLFNKPQGLQHILDGFTEAYLTKWRSMMASKLGLKGSNGDQDEALFTDLEKLLTRVETDMTLFYRQLAKLDLHVENAEFEHWYPLFKVCFYQPESVTGTEKENKVALQYQHAFSAWLTRYIDRSTGEHATTEQRQASMNSVNPKYVLRNYLAQQAIEKAERGDYSEIERLQTLLTHPYDEQPEFESYAEKRPEWARHKAGCSALSCSS
ncbi:MAG: YdiU family protein [Aliivibrio sp.]|uniref:protein adenylyltransferase SelO n=1 Tax=Aliivibrio sp. TaxID=1872443 RepID=UPI001A54001D|nr:YdiU family protein [Aliivibrio sp.]